jgi:hypothetical protein
MKAALQRFGPLAGGFLIDESVMRDPSSKTGVIQMTTSARPSIGHAACFVGFDDDKRLLKFKNQ